MLQGSSYYSVAEALFFSDLPVSKTFYVELSPLINGIVPKSALECSLALFRTSDLSLPPCEHFFPTNWTVSKLLPRHALASLEVAS